MPFARLHRFRCLYCPATLESQNTSSRDRARTGFAYREAWGEAVAAGWREKPVSREPVCPECQVKMRRGELGAGVREARLLPEEMTGVELVEQMVRRAKLLVGEALEELDGARAEAEQWVARIPEGSGGQAGEAEWGKLVNWLALKEDELRGMKWRRGSLT